jgi:putative ABC transport system permease protein
VESVLITFWGWVLGAVLGIIASYLLNVLAAYFKLSWEYSFPWQGIGVSLLFSLLCGFLFGYRPAKQAAKLDPVEALRIE